MESKTGIDQLVIVVVSSDQVGSLAQQLIKEGFYFTRVNSHWGILPVDMVSLLIGINSLRHQELTKLITQCCQTRLKYIPTQIDIPMFQGQPVMIEAEVGGAVIYTFDVERFEQL